MPYPIPQIQRTPTGTAQLIVDGKPHLILGGELHNSSASSLDHLDEHTWERAQMHNCNTLFVPVYWELLEPSEGQFNFSLVEGLIQRARTHKLRLVLLWFATWKNGRSHYAPAWVKTDTERFFRMQVAPNKTCSSISPMCADACQADSRAFSALMQHLAHFDAEDHTVIMVQVQNEPGLLGAPRDFSPAASAAFQTLVPSELSAALQERKENGNIRPEILRALADAQSQRSDPQQENLTWPELFGDAACEVFMAWHIAKYVNQVAQAGRAQYDLPCYANCWLVQHPNQHPGEYPSGGPVSRMMDIWQIAAPHLDALAPDIYLDNFASICADYTTLSNPLIIPEAADTHGEASAHAVYAFGQHNAIGFAPFGIDSLDDPRLAETYQLLSDLHPLITAHHNSEKMTAVLQGGYSNSGLGPEPGINRSDRVVITLENYYAEVCYHEPLQPGCPPAVALIIEETADQLIVAGMGNVDVNFSARHLAQTDQKLNVDYLSIEEGNYRDGTWIPGRRLNGDEYVVRLGEKPTVRRVSLYRYR
ncbi:DUF5597 domain-containing protein [Coraliomargarita algicola]|uniref:DUF5597 domain-containing protein n=1 Tax=Coraliomargarita algicola TaxID=3092156 RepID=A0ABZ0RNB4_9BACT|nr:DUF5597 domain-containing protein [Coraliomargarita sp. J2-16]WPJ96714.1 DUF5597 domain-containing protein [Coraliomargarita sp. J2-16]